MTHLELSRRRLARLLVGCPHSPDLDPNPRECPLHKIRTKSLRKRMEWARDRDPSVVARILEHHSWCQAKKTLEDLTAHCWAEDVDDEREVSPGRIERANRVTRRMSPALPRV